MGSHAVSQHRCMRSLCMKAALHGTTTKRSRRLCRCGSAMVAISSASFTRSQVKCCRTPRRPQPSISGRCRSLT